MSATNTINALVPGLAPGQRVYFRLIDQATGYYYNANTQTFGAYSPASIAEYTIVMTDAGAGVYLGTIPAVAASVYLATIYTDFGTSSALDSPVGQQTFAWTGTAIVYGGATASEVWAYTPRTLTSFGSLVADIWSNGTRTLTSYGTLVSDIWNNGTRTLTGPGSSGLALEATSQEILANTEEILAELPTPTPAGSVNTLNFKSDGIPVAQAQVWLTSDPAGNNVVEGTKSTNDAGNVQFVLSPGVTYYVWLQRAGVNPLLGVKYVAS